MSVIANVPTPVEFVMALFDDHARMKLILQVVKGISRVL